MILADAREELQARDQLLIAGRFCRSTNTNWRNQRGLVTWGSDERTFTVEHGHEQIARWMGYEVASEENAERADREDPELEVIWHGTHKTARGTFAAQFELEGM